MSIRARLVNAHSPMVQTVENETRPSTNTKIALLENAHFDIEAAIWPTNFSAFTDAMSGFRGSHYSTFSLSKARDQAVLLISANPKTLGSLKPYVVISNQSINEKDFLKLSLQLTSVQLRGLLRLVS